MALPHWAIELAETFWHEAGGPESFPRALRRSIANALPVTIVSLPRLRVAGVTAWLAEHAVPCPLGSLDRPLRACLVARYGHGLIFLDGTDPDDEQRFSLAHEVAHFLRDYWQPRHEATARLGPAVLEVLDGDRPARATERMDALLARASIGFHVHLMDRAGGRFATSAIERAERDADLLAYELLAPSALALALVTGRAPAEQVAALVHGYGLPRAAAARYAAILVPREERADSLLSRLGLRP